MTYLLTNDVDADTFVGDQAACFAKAAIWTGMPSCQVAESGHWQDDGSFLGGYPEGEGENYTCGFTLRPVEVIVKSRRQTFGIGSNPGGGVGVIFGRPGDPRYYGRELDRRLVTRSWMGDPIDGGPNPEWAEMLARVRSGQVIVTCPDTAEWLSVPCYGMGAGTRA